MANPKKNWSTEKKIVYAKKRKKEGATLSQIDKELGHEGNYIGTLLKPSSARGKKARTTKSSFGSLADEIMALESDNKSLKKKLDAIRKILAWK